MGSYMINGSIFIAAYGWFSSVRKRSDTGYRHGRGEARA
jgi:hypothetical protein